MRKKKICLITTGGTIAMKYDGKKGYVPALTGKDLYKQVPGLSNIANIDIIEFGNYPSPHIDLKIMFNLYLKVSELLNKREVDGIVITHGTDILEETAFFLDICLDLNKPVVFTAAMRTESELGVDGPRNLLAAVKVACDKRVSEEGVLIVLNDEIHDARYVTKTATSDLSTFKSPQYGSIGIVDEDRIILRRFPAKTRKLNIQSIENKVYLIKAYPGIDDTFINAALENGAKGIVIEGFGRGNIPPSMLNGVKKAIEKGIAVVVVSRCFQGRALGIYAYEGGGKHLVDLGVIMGGDLRGQKAWVLLSAALSYTDDINEIRRIFADYVNI